MNDLIKIVQVVAPTIASFLGTPIAGVATKVAVDFIASKLGVQAETKEELTQAIAGMTPDQMVKLKELDYDFQKFCKENDIKIDLAQIAVNLKEAESESLFVAGWRPAIGWICGVGLAYATIILPILEFISRVCFGYTGKFPVVDWAILGQCLMGILGLSAMRSYDKKNGNGNGH